MSRTKPQPTPSAPPTEPAATPETASPAPSTAETTPEPPTEPPASTAEPEPPVSAAAPEPVAAPEPKRYKVTEYCRYVRDGIVFTLPKGTVIDDLNYDVEECRKQGVPLEPATVADVDTTPSVGHRVQ